MSAFHHFQTSSKSLSYSPSFMPHRLRLFQTVGQHPSEAKEGPREKIVVSATLGTLRRPGKPLLDPT